jgi:hypothetical protein
VAAGGQTAPQQLRKLPAPGQLRLQAVLQHLVHWQGLLLLLSLLLLLLLPQSA